MAKDLFILGYNLTKKLFFISLVFIIFCVWLWPLKINAQTTGNVNVSAFVDSQSSASQSTVVADPLEILANNTEMSTITVTVKDSLGNPLNNLRVQPSSNRGAIDTIDPLEVNSNVVGEAVFTIKSSTAGKTTVSVFVDNAVTLNDKPEITFRKPPTATPITITVPIPPMFGIPGHKITLFKPSTELSKNALVEQGVELQIPFAIFIIGSLFVVSQPILLSVIVLQTISYRRRDKKIMEQQEEIIENEENISEKIDGNDNLPGTKIK